MFVKKINKINFKKIYKGPFSFLFRGLWNVPYISSCYLVNATLLTKYNPKQLSFVKDDLDADMAFCQYLRDLDIFMYISNRLDFGHLINPDTFDITLTKPDMYQIFENEEDWEQRYIHEDYVESLNPEKKTEQVKVLIA